MGVETNAVHTGLQQQWVTAFPVVYPNLMLPKLFGASIYSLTKTVELSLHFLWKTTTRIAEIRRGNYGSFSLLLLYCYCNFMLSGIRSFLSRFFKKRNDHKKKPVLELVDGLLNPQLTSYSRLNESQRLPSTGSCTSHDIQLQCLDARALLARTTTSTPASSLDLEWEHETLPISMINEPSGSSWTALPEDLSQYPSVSSPQNTAAVQNSDSDWSRVSSANSLEWDNVQNSIQASPPPSEIDTDTQFLLSEIERLTNQTLLETGQDLFS